MKRFRPDADLLFLSAVVLLINLPYLGESFVPVHDARYVFGVFSYYYNHLSVEHELPRWMVYGTFGIKATSFQFYFLSACSYPFLLGGMILGVKNALVLFTLSMVSEQLLFVTGVYLLSRRLFTDRLTILIVSFAAACSTVWYYQLFLNFRIFHLLPLALYFLRRFTAEKRPEFLWMTGLTFVLAGVGCPAYLYALPAFALSGVAVGLGGEFRRALRSIPERSWRNAAAFALMALVTVAVGLTLHQPMEGISLAESSNRDANTGAVPLDSFLTYGGFATTQLAGSFLGVIPEFGWGAERELTHYFGLLLVAVLPLALLRCRHPWFLALLLSSAVLLLMSLGGTFAALLFRLPMMGLFRHIGYATAVAKVLLLLASGFGIDLLLASLTEGLNWERRPRFLLLTGIFLGLWLILDLQIGGTTLARCVAGTIGAEPLMTVLNSVVRSAAYLAAAAVVLWPSRTELMASAAGLRAARNALALAVLIDGLMFQALIVSRMPTLSQPVAFPTREFSYPEHRTAQIDRALQPWLDSGFQGINYHLATCSLFQHDSPGTIGRSDWRASGIRELRDARADIVPDPVLQAHLGITAPKLRLISSVVFVDTPGEARRRVRDDPVVLRGVPPELRAAAPGDGTIRLKEFGANRLVAEVDIQGGGPVWLVYADSFHPGWTATVNDRPAPIAEASLAFKAVRVEKGLNVVRFVFHDGARTTGARMLALLSTLFAAAAFAVWGRLLFSASTPGSSR